MDKDTESCWNTVGNKKKCSLFENLTHVQSDQTWSGSTLKEVEIRSDPSWVKKKAMSKFTGLCFLFLP